MGRLWRRVCRKDSLRGKVARIVAPLGESFSWLVQEEGRTPPPHRRPVLRLSRIFRRSETTADPDAVPLARVVLWSLFAVVLVVGLVLYFKYERVVMPLLS